MVNMITVDDSGVVTAVSVGGYIQGGMDFYGDLPADFEPNKYRWDKFDVVPDKDGNIDGHCCIMRKIIVRDTGIDENGKKIEIEQEEITPEFGEFTLNPDYKSTTEQPVITQEQRISALEDATAEIIEMMLGGE